MIPRGIERKHIEKAVAKIDRDGVPSTRRSVHYDLIFDGKRYPPKYVIWVAAAIAGTSADAPSDFNAVEARDYLLRRKYEVRDRRTEPCIAIADEDDESRFPEGRVSYRRHRQLERDTEIARKAKERRLALTGRLACEVCDTDFFETYGECGEGFIEAHHTKPVSELNGTEKTKVRDLAMLCSNCHRMIHRSKVSVSELRRRVRERANP